MKEKLRDVKDSIVDFVTDNAGPIIAAVIILLFIGALIGGDIHKNKEFNERQGTYTVIEGGPNAGYVQVFSDGKRYEYQIDTVTDMVYLIDDENLIQTGMTKNKFINCLEDKGMRKDGD